MINVISGPEIEVSVMKKICTFNSRKYSVYLQCYTEKYHLLFLAPGNNLIVFSLEQLTIIHTLKNFGHVEEMVLTKSEDYIVLSVAKEGDFYDCYQLNLVEIEKEINYEFVGQVIGNQSFALSLYKFENSVLLAMKDKIVLYDCEERKIISEVPEKFPSNIVVKLSEDVDSDLIYVQYVSGYNVISRSYMLKDNSFQCANIEKLEYTTHYSRTGNLRIIHYLEPRDKKKPEFIIENIQEKKKVEFYSEGGIIWNFKLSLSEKYLWITKNIADKRNQFGTMCGLLLRTDSTNVNQLGVDSVSFNEFNFDEYLNYMTTNDYQLDHSKYFSRLAIYKVEESDKLNVEFSKISTKKLPKIRVDDTGCKDYWI